MPSRNPYTVDFNRHALALRDSFSHIQREKAYLPHSSTSHPDRLNTTQRYLFPMYLQRLLEVQYDLSKAVSQGHRSSINAEAGGAYFTLERHSSSHPIQTTMEVQFGSSSPYYLDNLNRSSIAFSMVTDSDPSNANVLTKVHEKVEFDVQMVFSEVAIGADQRETKLEAAVLLINRPDITEWLAQRGFEDGVDLGLIKGPSRFVEGGIVSWVFSFIIV